MEIKCYGGCVRTCHSSDVFSLGGLLKGVTEVPAGCGDKRCIVADVSTCEGFIVADGHGDQDSSTGLPIYGTVAALPK